MNNQLIVPFRHRVSGMMISSVILDIAQATGAHYLELPAKGSGVACVCASVDSRWDITVHAAEAIDSKKADDRGIEIDVEYDFVLVMQKPQAVFMTQEIDDFRAFEVFINFVETFRNRVNNLRCDPQSHFSH